MKTLTKAEVEHLRKALGEYRDLIESYPETVTSRQEDRLLIAEEIMSEDSNS